MLLLFESVLCHKNRLEVTTLLRHFLKQQKEVILTEARSSFSLSLTHTRDCLSKVVNLKISVIVVLVTPVLTVQLQFNTGSSCNSCS